MKIKEYSKPLLSEKEIINTLIALQRNQNRLLTPSDYIKATVGKGQPDLEAIVDLLGPWSTILEKIERQSYLEKGVLLSESEEVINQISSRATEKNKILKALSLYLSENGKGISLERYEEWRKNQSCDFPSTRKIRSVFGSWGRACEVAGLDPRSRYSEVELVYTMKKAYRDLGRIPSCQIYRSWAVENEAPSPKAFIRHYGTWKNAIRAIFDKYRH